MATSAYYASCVPGRAGVLAGEITRKVPGAQIGVAEANRLHFTAPRRSTELTALWTAEHVFLDLGSLDGLDGSAADLDRFEAWLARPPVRDTLGRHPGLEGYTELRFRITGTRAGRHEYRSIDAAAAAGAGVVTQTGWAADLDRPQADFRLQIRDGAAVLGLRLSADATARRLPVSGVASLKPTVAHAMCLLGDPQPNELVLDPMCGAGAILRERLTDLPPATVLGGDLHPNALSAARQNLADLCVPLMRTDVRAIPLPDGTVDKPITNPP